MNVRFLTSLILVVCLVSFPISTLAKKGEKNFRKGIKHEMAQQWDKAVQELVLAVAADPSNMEYQLHYRRALFNASQLCMRQGRALAEQQDFVGAYNSFRQAYAYDGVNQLAVSEMQRMLRLKEETTERGANKKIQRGADPGFKHTSYRVESGEKTSNGTADQIVPFPRSQQLRLISYEGDLEALINSLAVQLDLNVVFDKQSFAQPRTLRINLRDVTTAKALDLIFLKEGLFFQKVDRRTILVADNTRRPQYQQLVLRTFYLSNIEPPEAQKIVQAAIPPSVGRPQTIVVADKSTNSLTVRDTSENVRLIGELIKNIDKDRSEVVMDVQIYEVSATDLLQIGNQLGTDTTLANLGGAGSLSVIGGSREVAQQLFAAPTALGAALVLPGSTLSLLQKKNRTRVLASTQIHAFDGEKSEVHIGQRVPVQTAQVYTTTTSSTSTTTASGVYGSTGYPVINYEPTGLTLEFTPQVYPNLDVQVKMAIKSNDVAGASSLTPTFTERTLSGTARIQNNQTMMIASVSTDQQSQGRSGLPLVGLVPVFGRLFTAPSNDGKRTDIVVAVTPRVLRAPAVTPRDEEARPSGTLQSPTTESLEAVVAEADREDQIAAARIMPTTVNVQIPDQENVAYVPAPKSLLGNKGTVIPQPIDGGAIQPASQIALASSQARAPFSVSTDLAEQRLALSNRTESTATVSGAAELVLVSDHNILRAGEKTTVTLMLRTADAIGFSSVKLKFDRTVIDVKNISPGKLYDNLPTPQITQSASAGELALLISGATTRGSGPLLTFTIEAKQKGETLIELVRGAIHLISPEGQEITVARFGEVRIIVQ